jgi:tetratricopeptide (TPR) repeat protein
MRGEYAASERMHLQALANAERRWGAGHPNVASNYNNISFIYFDQFDLDRAIEWMERAVTATGDETSWDDIALQQANLARMLVAAGRAEDAAVAIGRASEAAQGNDEYPGVQAHVATVRSLVESALGNGDVAEQCALEASRLRGPDPSAEDAARTEVALGRARLEKGDLAGALAALNAAVEHREQAYGHRHSMVVDALELRSRVRALLGDEQGELEDAIRAAAIRDAVRASR